MANGKTKVTDKGFKRIRKDLKVTDGSSVDVGILKGEASIIDQVSGSKFEVAEIAAVQEFGTTRAGRNNNVTIAERSFMRSTVDAKKSKYEEVLKSLMVDVLLGLKTVNQALSLFGERVVGDIKKKITSIKSPPNAPSTIEAKGFDNPLIHTGTMRSRIKKKVNL